MPLETWFPMTTRKSSPLSACTTPCTSIGFYQTPGISHPSVFDCLNIQYKTIVLFSFLAGLSSSEYWKKFKKYGKIIEIELEIKNMNMIMKRQRQLMNEMMMMMQIGRRGTWRSG